MMMGNKVSHESNQEKQPMDESGWIVVDVHPEKSLTFNPLTSYALCAGVGEQRDHSWKKHNLGYAADRDAVAFANLLWQKFDIPDEQIVVLTSKLEPATDKAILSALSKQAKRVQEDGMLVVQFSGHVHRIERKNTVVLVPANFDGTSSSVVTIPSIVKAVQGTKARYVLMVMDCCYAGGVGEELVMNLPENIPTYILASCSSQQKSLSFNELGNGFFTYFLLKYFHSYDSKDFPLNDVVMFCKPLCNAINKILNPGFVHDASMSPQMIWNMYKVKTLSIGADVDVVDANADPLWYIVKYQKRFSNYQEDQADSPWQMSEIPEMVLLWLHHTARESLKVLYGQDVLSRREMPLYSTVLAFVSQSTVKLLHDNFKKTKDHDSFFRVSVMLEAYRVLAEILFRTVDYSLAPDLRDFRLYLEYYIFKVRQLANTTYESHQMVELITLLSKVISETKNTYHVRVNRRMNKGDIDQTDGEIEEAGEDVVDGTDITALGLYLDALPLAPYDEKLPQLFDDCDEATGNEGCT